MAGRREAAALAAVVNAETAARAAAGSNYDTLGWCLRSVGEFPAATPIRRPAVEGAVYLQRINRLFRQASTALNLQRTASLGAVLQFRVARALISVSRAREVPGALCGHPAHSHFSGVCCNSSL